MLFTSRANCSNFEAKFSVMDGPTGLTTCRAFILVLGENGVRQHGCYHNLGQDQRSKIEGELSRLRAWSTECFMAGVSASDFFQLRGQELDNVRLYTRHLDHFNISFMAYHLND